MCVLFGCCWLLLLCCTSHEGQSISLTSQELARNGRVSWITRRRRESVGNGGREGPAGGAGKGTRRTWGTSVLLSEGEWSKKGEAEGGKGEGGRGGEGGRLPKPLERARRAHWRFADLSPPAALAFVALSRGLE